MSEILNSEGPAWWLWLCEQHNQDPDDPDAFCFYPPRELDRLIADAKARVATR